jgi:hypothetical protein
MEAINYFRTKTLRLETKLENAQKAGIVSPNERNVLPYIDVSIGNQIYPSTLAIIDLLANFNWERPIYWGVTAPTSFNLGLDKHFKNEGFANLLTPEVNRQGDSWIETDSVYDKIMNVFEFRNLNNPNVYYDENCVRMVASYRRAFISTIYALLNENKNEKAKDLLNKYMEIFPKPEVSEYYSVLGVVDAFYYVEEHERANEISDMIAFDAEQQLRFFRSLKQGNEGYSYALQHVRMLEQSARRHGQAEQSEKLNSILAMYR